MKSVYKHLSGYVVGAPVNSNGPIRAKMKRGFVSRVTVPVVEVHSTSLVGKPNS